MRCGLIGMLVVVGACADGLVIEGRVVGPDRLPMEGVEVTRPSDRPGEVDRAVTGADGFYRFEIEGDVFRGSFLVAQVTHEHGDTRAWADWVDEEVDHLYVPDLPLARWSLEASVEALSLSVSWEVAPDLELVEYEPHLRPFADVLWPGSTGTAEFDRRVLQDFGDAFEVLALSHPPNEYGEVELRVTSPSQQLPGPPLLPASRGAACTAVVVGEDVVVDPCAVTDGDLDTDLTIAIAEQGEDGGPASSLTIDLGEERVVSAVVLQGLSILGGMPVLSYSLDAAAYVPLAELSATPYNVVVEPDAPFSARYLRVEASDSEGLLQSLGEVGVFTDP